MKFCSKCGLVMVYKKSGGKTYMACRKCGHKIKDYKPMKISEKVFKKPMDDVVIIEGNAESLPRTRTECPKCSHVEAVWWIQQTRSADEAPTLFLRCVKCRHSWREYG